MLLLNNTDVAKVLDMPLCMDALDGVFQELAIGDAVGEEGALRRYGTGQRPVFDTKRV